MLIQGSMKPVSVLLVTVSITGLLTLPTAAVLNTEPNQTTTLTSHAWGVNVATDKEAYAPGDVVAIAGNVTDGPHCVCKGRDLYVHAHRQRCQS